ncbi:hypothetical protein BDV26DRAFT_253325 [Aspergillus bertholletiae]|uniref:Uncharacterized protein n=1 Tax=Aspergillus bertholletiae TaxID=1226010 RepID=A0A5N7BLD9_9EURO|nr:hypothetical protein BDV26DRAFT_253325 [Aspergillus bertholletiae]
MGPSFPMLLMFLAVLILTAMVPALDVPKDLGNVYDGDHLLGIPTFEEPGALLPRAGFVTVTVTDTVCAPPPVSTTAQHTGANPGAPGVPQPPTVTTISGTTVVTGTDSTGTAPTVTGPTGAGSTVVGPVTTATGTTLSTGTQSGPPQGTVTSLVSTKPSSGTGTVHPTSSQSPEKPSLTATASGSQTSTAAPTSNEAVVQERINNVLLVLTTTFIGFLMI